MKKIFFWVMLMTVALAVTAEENLYRMAPADTAGTLRLQTGALLAQPLLKDLAARSGLQPQCPRGIGRSHPVQIFLCHNGQCRRHQHHPEEYLFHRVIPF